MFRLSPMSLEEARSILSWHYPEPYDFYDPATPPEDAELLLDEAYRKEHLMTARDESGLLRGFFEFHSEGGVVEVGLGLRPVDTGRGLGDTFLAEGLAYARARFHPHTFRLFVATFNQRAIKVYERAGFQEVERQWRNLLGQRWEFLEMRRDD